MLKTKCLHQLNLNFDLPPEAAKVFLWCGSIQVYSSFSVSQLIDIVCVVKVACVVSAVSADMQVCEMVISSEEEMFVWRGVAVIEYISALLQTTLDIFGVCTVKTVT